jgi:hypothetical protein
MRNRTPRIWRSPKRRKNGARFVSLLIAFVGIADVAAAQDALPRLPRAAFDVIAPSERVQGGRGGMTVYQSLCRNAPTSWARRRVVDVAVQEWAFFGMQTIDATRIEERILPPGLVPDAINPKLPAPRIEREFARLGTPESNDELDTTIAGYWSSTPDGPRILAQQNDAWSAPGGNSVGWVQPWSAAFISWVMCEAGLGEMTQFQRSIAHRNYIDQAIRARDGMDADAAYVAHDAGEAPIEPGDLLCNARASAEYRMLADRRRDVGRFAPTHCDIVVKIDERAGRIFVIGGNVVQSVSLTILPLQRDGDNYAKPVDESIIDGARTVFAHLKLRADPVELNALDNSPTVRALSAPTN